MKVLQPLFWAKGVNLAAFWCLTDLCQPDVQVDCFGSRFTGFLRSHPWSLKVRRLWGSIPCQGGICVAEVSAAPSWMQQHVERDHFSVSVMKARTFSDSRFH